MFREKDHFSWSHMFGFFSFYLNDKHTIRPTNPTVTIYVDVDDLQKTLDRVTSLGGSVVMPAMEVEGGRGPRGFEDRPVQGPGRQRDRGHEVAGDVVAERRTMVQL